ncbi:MAG: hypothetical protein J0H22_14795 [Actinobacteria bacterium]|nr:hypothetical protein [Actinomycetota bacterium]
MRLQSGTNPYQMNAGSSGGPGCGYGAAISKRNRPTATAAQIPITTTTTPTQTPAVWLNLGTGAMVAAIPTGTWRQPAKFAFYHAAPGAAQALPLAAWTDEQEQWDGSTVNQCDDLYAKAVAYFDATVTGGSAWSSPAWFGGEIRSATNSWGELDG